MDNASLAKEHLPEAVDLLSLTTALAILYTLVFILYCLSFRLAYAQLRDDYGKIKRRTVYTLVFQTVLLICATLDIILGNRMAQVLYIDNSTSPGGPLGESAELGVATLSLLQDVVSLVEEFLVLGVLLWRVWVVWSGTRFVIPITVVSVFLYLGNEGLTISYYGIVWYINFGTHVQTSQALQPIIQASLTIFITSEVVAIASSVFMSLAIVARLLFTRRKHIKVMGRSDVDGQYLSIAAMLVESYALDTLWGIGLLISQSLNYAPTSNFFSDCITQVEILTNFLLVYRVFSGRAWTRQTGDRLSTLRWGSNGAGTTTLGTVDQLRQTAVPEGAQPVISFRDGV